MMEWLKVAPRANVTIHLCAHPHSLRIHTLAKCSSLHTCVVGSVVELLATDVFKLALEQVGLLPAVACRQGPHTALLGSQGQIRRRNVRIVPNRIKFRNARNGRNGSMLVRVI